MKHKVGGTCHPKLITDFNPIANKYHKGKMKRTLKRDLKYLEPAGWEAKWTREYASSSGEHLGRCVSGTPRRIVV